MIVDDDLIAKFLSGEATPEEAMALHEWLAIPVNKARFEELSATWNQSNPAKAFRAPNKEQAWKKVRPARSLVWPIGIAASIIALIGIWFVLTRAQVAEAEMLTASATNDPSSVQLPDHSTITLNSHSQIKYPAEFNKDTREVNLESGEAFFKVSKDSLKPFIVHTAFANVKVVGTQFNVIINGDAVEVGVDEGLVLVFTATDSVYLGKGAAAFVRSGQPVRKARMDVNTWAYATRSLVFKDTPMDEVIGSIEKTYSCKVVVSNDDVKNCKFTANFNNESVDNVLHLISETLNLKLEQNGQVFTLEGGGCP